LKKVKIAFTKEIADCGWQPADVETIIDKGVYGFEKQIVLEELNQVVNARKSRN